MVNKKYTGIVIYILVGFGRACAPVRCAHPSFFGLFTTPNGALRAPPPIAASLLPPNKKKLFPETKSLPPGPNSGRQGHMFSHWATLRPTELRCTLVSYAAPS